MRVWPWFKMLAIVLFIFALGHTLGTAAPKVRHGSAEAQLFVEMQAFRFPIMGFERSYWDFYRGFALIISILLAVMSAVAWQLSAVSKNNPGLALPTAISLLLGCFCIAVISWMFFFTMPIVLAALALMCSAIPVAMLVLKQNS